ncbi:MAG: hypothetical protein ABWZ99_06035 [Ilumatobacteraceae bacterium]
MTSTWLAGRSEITVDAPRTAIEAAVQERLDVDRAVVNAPNEPTSALREALDARLSEVGTVSSRA